MLNTSDGSVTGTRLGGDIQIRSGDGSIRLDHTTGKLDLETTDGSIGLEAQPTVLRARTGDGSIRATIEPDTVMADNWELTTSDGNVTLTLPGLFNAELDAETRRHGCTNHPLLGDDDRDRRRDEDNDSAATAARRCGPGSGTAARLSHSQRRWHHSN